MIDKNKLAGLELFEDLTIIDYERPTSTTPEN